MRVKNITFDDMVNFHQPSLFIGTCFCDWKCCSDAGMHRSICQNSLLEKAPIINIPNSKLLEYFHDSIFQKAVVVGGLEPFLQWDELYSLISYFRVQKEYCPFVIYTGYNRCEITQTLSVFEQFKPICVKFGRFIPNCETHFDATLGVKLASPNQYAVWL